MRDDAENNWIFFENPMSIILPIEVVPVKVGAACVSPGRVIITTALTIIHFVSISFLLH